MQLVTILLVSLFSQAAPIDGLPLPPPSPPKAHLSKIIGWKTNEKPTAPAGFTVTRFADKFDEPRWVYADPASNDLYVAESKAGRITLLRDSDGDGKYETRSEFIKGLNRPFGMALVDGSFYVATTDGLWKYAYAKNATKLTTPGAKLLSLPAGGYNNHWTRNLLLSRDKKRFFITVGSGSNDGENGMKNEIRRANILSVALDGSDEKIVASGLRNPVGMDYASDGALWTVVNERDNLGDNLVPDYLTSVKDGGFYGWPYVYFGGYEDPSWKGKSPTTPKAIVPDVALGSHTASLGLAFYTSKVFPEKYQGGAFIGQHGSWNSSKLVGYAVKYVPFNGAKAVGAPEDFLTGFIANASKYEVHGRPVGVTLIHDGSLLVVDDGADVIWRVAASAAK